jgi:hypothetical protein
MKKIALGLVGLILLFSGLTYAENLTISASVQKYISVTFSYSSVDFGTLTSGTSNNPATGQEDGVYNVTIDTNYPYYVVAYGTDFSNGAGHSFSISNLRFDVETDPSLFNPVHSTPLSHNEYIINSFSEGWTHNYHAYWLSIPAGQYASSYSATVTINYVNQ